MKIVIAYLSKANPLDIKCIDYMVMFLWEHELRVGTIISLYY